LDVDIAISSYLLDITKVRFKFMDNSMAYIDLNIDLINLDVLYNVGYE
jgi:hypothetical protein